MNFTNRKKRFDLINSKVYVEVMSLRNSCSLNQGCPSFTRLSRSSSSSNVDRAYIDRDRIIFVFFVLSCGLLKSIFSE